MPEINEADSSTVPHCRRSRQARALAALLFAWIAASPPAAASTSDPTLQQLGCAVGTLAGVVPVSSVVYKAVSKAISIASCPSFLDAVGPSVPFEDYAAGCFPQLGSYSTCSWAQSNANVQTWIESGRALNGTIDGMSDEQARLTCIYVVGQEGMYAPAAAQNQGGCTLGHFYTPPPPPVTRRILIVGDSITQGSDGDYTWRYRLHEHLRASGESFDFVGPWTHSFRPAPFEDHNGGYAVDGWDQQHSARWGRPLWGATLDIEQEVRTEQPDLIVVHLGTNDMTWFGMDAAQTADTMRQFVANARRGNPDVDLLLVQIGDTAPLDDARVGAYDQLLAQIAAELSSPWSEIHVADVAPHWNWPTDTYDGTHPNARGEYVIAKYVADALYTHWGWGAPFGAIPSAPPPPRPTNVVVTPDTIGRLDGFTVSWDRVVNPGIWTEYRVEVRYHQAFGFGLVWASPQTTPDTSLAYTGPWLPQAGTFHVVVVAQDQFGQTTRSNPVPLQVHGEIAPPPKPANVRVMPGVIGRDGGFVATWDRVVNPGIWTEYRVQLHYHQLFGGGLVWQSSGTTPDLSLVYDGPRLPQAGTFEVVVVAVDQFGHETWSDRVPVQVQESVPPPLPPTNVRVSPPRTDRASGFTVTWDRVVNPKIWTEYRVELRYHELFGGFVVWQSPQTPDLEVTYGGPVLPQAGTYQVVVVARDPWGQETESAKVPLEVHGDPPPPLPPENVAVFPNTIRRTDSFLVAWDRVPNPGVWTEYKVRICNHPLFGGCAVVVWETPGTTPDISLAYDGPALPQNGTYYVEVIARDQFGAESVSAGVPLRVMDTPAPPPAPEALIVGPNPITSGQGFTAIWNRVDHPLDIWTEYGIAVLGVGSGGLYTVWQSQTTPDLIMAYGGPTLGAGTYLVVVFSRDVFGQQSLGATAELTVNPACGLGAELALLPLLLRRLARLRRRRASA